MTMFTFKITEEASVFKNKVNFNKFSKYFENFHYAILNEPNVNIACDFENNIEKPFFMAFYSLNKEHLEYLKNNVLHVNAKISEIDLEAIKEYYTVKKSKGINDKWTRARILNVIKYVIDNFEQEFKLGSRAYYVKKIILSIDNFDKIELEQYVDTFRARLLKQDDKRFLFINSSSTKQKFNLSIKRKYYSGTPEFNCNRYGLSTQDGVFTIPILK